MMRLYRLVRITSADYRDYRRTRAKIEYSFFLKGEEQPELAKMIREELAEIDILSKGNFLDLMEKDENAFYFFKDGDEIKGIAEIVFDDAKHQCNICEFAVLQHGEGLGTIFYQEVLKVIKERKATQILLFCPFSGAQIFWWKMGFKVKEVLPEDRGIFFKKRVR